MQQVKETASLKRKKEEGVTWKARDKAFPGKKNRKFKGQMQNILTEFEEIQQASMAGVE